MTVLRPLALVALAALGAGCNDLVSPTMDTGRPYTMWGVLNPTTDLQGIRVAPIGLVLDESGATAPLGARVESVDLATGARVTWRDSLVHFADGSAGHVYVAGFRPRYDAAYEVTATREDGAVSHVRVRTPPAVEPIVLSINPTSFTLPVLWTQAPSINALQVTYAYQQAGCGYGQETFNLTGPYPFEYGWRVDILLGQVAGQIRSRLGLGSQTGLALLSANVTAFVSNTEWRAPFGTVYDPEILVEPGRLENVENGFGFVGSGFDAAVLWRPPADATVPGFVTPQALGCMP